MELELRPYQECAINELRESIRSGKIRPILYSPTGSGKTEIATKLIKLATSKKKRCLFVINRVELINQTSRRFFQSRLQHGVIQGDNTRATYENVLICSIQTLIKRGFPEADFIIIDEAHFCAGSKAYIALIEHYKDIPIIGLSATPFSKGLGKEYSWGKLFENIIVATTIGDLIDQRYLVDVDIFAPGKPDMSGVRTTGGDWNEKDLGVACDKPKLIGDIVDNWKKIAKWKPTVCFAVNIAHSKHIVDMFCRSGVPAEHIDCYTSEDERKAILDRVFRMETLLLSNVGILSTGWDFPACEVMILAKPTKSLILFIQMVGRVLRPFAGKEKAILLDHSGTTELLGSPTDDLPLELDDGKPKLAKGDRVQKEKPLLKPCPKCFYVKRTPGICPICKFKPEKQNTIRNAPGELQLIKKKKKPTKIEKQAIYSELLYIADDRGYTNGWVGNTYRSFFGVWPRGLIDERKTPSIFVEEMVKKSINKFANEKKRWRWSSDTNKGK